MAQRDEHSGAVCRDGSGRMIPKTSHSLNPVPLVVVLPDTLRGRFQAHTVAEPALANVAGTCLTLMGLAVPADFAPSLVEAL